ncbi:hypothetical protein KD33_17120 [Clostridium sp. NCR]|nr:hypothetical protein KD33_17120 [Clostridium sp. NCR]
MQNAKKLIELNNSYRELLSEENKLFYDDILVYIRSKSFLKDETQIEESLLEILTDIIEAQNQEIKAEDYFGKNTKEISDEILKNTNKSSFKERFHLFLSCMFIYSLVTLLPNLVNPNESLDVGKFFICFITALLLVSIIFSIIGNTVYSPKEKKFTFILFVLFCTYIGLMILMEQILPTTFGFKLTGYIGITIILIFGGIGVIYSLKEKLFYSFLPIIVVACTLGILSRLEFLNFSIIESPGKTISMVAMLIAFILFYLISYLYVKE